MTDDVVDLEIDREENPLPLLGLDLDKGAFARFLEEIKGFLMGTGYNLKGDAGGDSSPPCSRKSSHLNIKLLISGGNVHNGEDRELRLP